MTRKGSQGETRPAALNRNRLGIILGGVSVLTVCVVVRYYGGTKSATAETAWTEPSGNVSASYSSGAPSTAAPVAQAASADAASSAPRGAQSTPRSALADTTALAAKNANFDKKVPQLVAYVNGRQITRDDLARECLRHYGKEVLEAMVNKYLIVQECRRRGLSITRTEVNTEIERMSAHFGVPVDQWLKLLKQERGIKPEQYANDIIWPTLALRKLAGEKLTVTQDELVQVFETEYGPAVRARLIACSTREKAEKLRSAAAASPQQFGNLAKDFSEDAASASAKGLIQPIRKHGNYKEIEQTAFSMADGEVSPVIFAGGQYVIIKREGLLEARKVKLQQISSQLEEMIRDRKMRTLATQIFSQLQKHAVVENVFNDPVKSQQMPGVAALLNGTQITMRQLAEECVERHGEEVLDTMIHRTLLEVACQQQRITVSDKEIDEEIARAADMAVKPLPDGTPDVKTFLTMVTEKQHIPADVYREDVVWPTAAMKKLAGSRITVTEEDLRKGFEANYGPRAKCRAIVMNNLRRAQQVWEMARKTPTLENFGNLAAQYSIEGGSRALQGEVPPIQKNGGQPELEKEAFSLKPGELSGVIQVDDKFVILWCEGYTKPTEVDFAKVRDLIYQDVREKKQQLAMVDYFERLQDMATIDNFLAGTSKTPLRSANLGLPTLHEVPSGK